MERQVIHEAPHEENAPPARLEQVFLGKRVDYLAWVKFLPLVYHSNHELSRLKSEFDNNALLFVLAIAVLDGVDNRLVHPHAHPVRRILVKVPDPAYVVAQDLRDIQHVEVADKSETNDVPDFSQFIRTIPGRQ